MALHFIVPLGSIIKMKISFWYKWKLKVQPCIQDGIHELLSRNGHVEIHYFEQQIYIVQHKVQQQAQFNYPLRTGLSCLIQIPTNGWKQIEKQQKFLCPISLPNACKWSLLVKSHHQEIHVCWVPWLIKSQMIQALMANRAHSWKDIYSKVMHLGHLASK